MAMVRMLVCNILAYLADYLQKTDDTNFHGKKVKKYNYCKKPSFRF